MNNQNNNVGSLQTI